jgi:hypothetical protein
MNFKIEKYLYNYTLLGLNITYKGVKMDRKERLYLDKVERKFLAQIKDMTPEYADLELYQVAHLELKEAILGKVRETLKNRTATPRTMPLMFKLVRKLTIFIYRFQNKLNLYGDF